MELRIVAEAKPIARPRTEPRCESAVIATRFWTEHDLTRLCCLDDERDLGMRRCPDPEVDRPVVLMRDCGP